MIQQTKTMRKKPKKKKKNPTKMHTNMKERTIYEDVRNQRTTYPLLQTYYGF